MEVRSKFYELLSHCIPPTVILKVKKVSLTLLQFLWIIHEVDCCRACSGTRRWGLKGWYYALGCILRELSWHWWSRAIVQIIIFRRFECELGARKSIILKHGWLKLWACIKYVLAFYGPFFGPLTNSPSSTSSLTSICQILIEGIYVLSARCFLVQFDWGNHGSSDDLCAPPLIVAQSLGHDLTTPQVGWSHNWRV